MLENFLYGVIQWKNISHCGNSNIRRSVAEERLLGNSNAYLTFFAGLAREGLPVLRLADFKYPLRFCRHKNETIKKKILKTQFLNAFSTWWKDISLHLTCQIYPCRIKCIRFDKRVELIVRFLLHLKGYSSPKTSIAQMKDIYALTSEWVVVSFKSFWF